MVNVLGILGDYFAGKALDAADEVLTEIVSAPANPFEEIRRRMGGEAAFEFTLAFERHVRDQEAVNANFREQLRQKVTEREVCALFPVLLRAAVESSTRERMRMLCAALAGIWRPDLEAETRSRVARAVRELEPSDVLHLRALERDPRPGANSFRSASQGALVSTGCIIVRVEEEELGKVLAKATRRRRDLGSVRTEKRTVELVSDVGRAVIASLRTWTPEM